MSFPTDYFKNEKEFYNRCPQLVQRWQKGWLPWCCCSGDLDRFSSVSGYPVSGYLSKSAHGISPQESSLPLSDVIACPFSVSDHQPVLVNKMSNCQMNFGDTINQNQFHVDEVQVHHHNEQHVYQHHPRVTNNTVYNINNTYIVSGDQSTSLKAIEGVALGQCALLVLQVVNCFPVA